MFELKLAERRNTHRNLFPIVYYGLIKRNFKQNERDTEGKIDKETEHRLSRGY